MKSRVLGISTLCGNNVTLNEVLIALGKSKAKKSYRGRSRRFFMDKVIDDGHTYHVGLIISSRDQRKDCELNTKGRKLSISIRELQKGTDLIDFNFFAFSPFETSPGRINGVYQHYRGAMSIRDFGSILKLTYEDERLRQRDVAMQNRPEDGISKTAHMREVNAKYRRDFDWHHLVRPEDFNSLIRKLKTIRELRYKVTTPCATEPVFKPLAQYTNYETKVFSFSDQSPKALVADTIKRAVDSLGLEDVAVRGKDANGKDETYQIIDNPSIFDEREYEDLADYDTLNLKAVGDSPFIGDLIKILKDNTGLFGRTP